MMCVIRGRASPPGVDVAFAIDKGGMSDGILYVPRSFMGRIGRDGGVEGLDGGAFRVPPSTDVGPYTVSIGPRVWSGVDVPPGPFASLADLLADAGG